MTGTPKISRAEFDFLIRRAGLTLSEAQKAELYSPYASLEMLIERLHAKLPLSAEPAVIYAFPKDAK
ncbi:MAG TPA: hypothetical protein VN802_00155 [Stellaceae bacterium]|nr:hypothetical protein [Stellaceae bacterium]